MKDGTKIKGVFTDDRMEGRGEMIDKNNVVTKGIYSYGVVNEELTNKQLGCKDKLVGVVSYYTTLVVNKL